MPTASEREQPSEVRPMVETTEEDETAEGDENDGFNVEEEVPPEEWVDFGYDEFGEYIHLIPDIENGELRCYRSINEAAVENRRLKTTIEEVSFTFNFEEDGRSWDDLNGFYLTDSEAKSFMTFIDLLCGGRESSVFLNWWEESGMPMMEDERTGIEDIHLRFTKPNGVERRTTITSAWQTPIHKMANIEGEK